MLSADESVAIIKLLESGKNTRKMLSTFVSVAHKFRYSISIGDRARPGVGEKHLIQRSNTTVSGITCVRDTIGICLLKF